MNSYAKAILGNMAMAILLLVFFAGNVLYAKISGNYPDIGWLEVALAFVCALELFQLCYMPLPKKD